MCMENDWNMELVEGNEKESPHVNFWISGEGKLKMCKERIEVLVLSLTSALIHIDALEKKAKGEYKDD